MVLVSLHSFLVHSSESVINFIDSNLRKKAKTKPFERFTQPLTFEMDGESVTFYTDPELLQHYFPYFQAGEHFNDVNTIKITGDIDPIAAILLFDFVGVIIPRSIKDDLIWEVASWDEEQWQNRVPQTVQFFTVSDNSWMYKELMEAYKMSKDIEMKIICEARAHFAEGRIYINTEHWKYIGPRVLGLLGFHAAEDLYIGESDSITYGECREGVSRYIVPLSILLGDCNLEFGKVVGRVQRALAPIFDKLGKKFQVTVGRSWHQGFKYCDNRPLRIFHTIRIRVM